MAFEQSHIESGANTHDAAGQKCGLSCLQEVMSSPRKAEDASMNISETAKKIADIVSSAKSADEAVHNPELGKLLVESNNHHVLFPTVIETNDLLAQNSNLSLRRIGASETSNPKEAGSIVVKLDCEDIVDKLDLPKHGDFGPPLSEAEKWHIPAELARNIAKDGHLLRDQDKDSLLSVLQRASEHGQLDGLSYMTNNLEPGKTPIDLTRFVLAYDSLNNEGQEVSQLRSQILTRAKASYDVNGSPIPKA